MPNSRSTASVGTEDEAYTSKTCCNCGHIDQKLGNKDVYNCKECGIEVLRDINGAINILLRFFTKRAGLELITDKVINSKPAWLPTPNL